MSHTKHALWALLTFGAVVIPVGFFGFGAWMRGYAWSEMDWNEDGRTAVLEFLRSADVGKREIQINGVVCIEFYALKDGLPVRTICPKEGLENLNP